MGGLGNQLFQIFAMIAYSMRYKNPFVFQYVKTPNPNSDVPDRPTYWDTFLYSLKKYTNANQLISNETLQQFQIYHCPHDYCVMPTDVENILFNGYFQSYLYFKHEYSRIYELLDIDVLKTRVGTIDGGIPNRPTVSIHFRLGDYVYKQCYHPVLSREYYKRATRYIVDTIPDGKYSRFFVFYEQSDVEYISATIAQLAQNLPDTVEFIMMEPDEDWKQLLMIGKCNHHIIANSTFSWWGACLSRNRIDEYSKDKIICYPSIWYGHQLYYISVETLFPKNWTKIDALSEHENSVCSCFL
jgi:hypothetical protein